MLSFSIQTMLRAGLHFGHQTRDWNPKVKDYLYGSRNKIHIFDLGITYQLLKEALEAIRHIASKKGKILFIGTKYAARPIVKQEAERCGMPYVNHRWLGGLLTNYKTIRQSIKRLKELEAMFESNRFGRLTKKEILNLSREKDKLNNNLGGIKHMGGLPDALFVIDVGHEEIAIREANRLGIMVSGVVDSNNDPDGISYPIPGNDDASRAIRFYLALVADTILQARTKQPEEMDVAGVGYASVEHAEHEAPFVAHQEDAKEIQTETSVSGENHDSMHHKTHYDGAKGENNHDDHH